VTTRAAPGHIVITGAGGAIGAALARVMSQTWPHAKLALVDRDGRALDVIVNEIGATATSYIADLADIDELEPLIARIETAGAIDVLVNCAGIMRVQNVASWKWDDASTLLAIDLLAPLRLMDLVVHGMVERGAGVIINVSSMAGRVPLRGCTYYGAAKAGLAMASEIARADLADRGVQVITVYPGPVRSALEAGARADYGGGGVFGRFAPTGDPAELAARIMDAIATDEARVIYPRLYGVGWSAPNLSRWVALSYGPPPVS
jgi:short-subunit dehydrogenase